jgi:hypothetical protein
MSRLYSDVCVETNVEVVSGFGAEREAAYASNGKVGSFAISASLGNKASIKRRQETFQSRLKAEEQEERSRRYLDEADGN